jgi:hypothetical protein
MGSSATPLPSRDASPRAAPQGARSSALLLAAKGVLGIAGIAGCMMLGAGGALLIKHLLAPDARSGSPAATTAPATRARPEPEAARPSATFPGLPAAPDKGVVSAPDASGISPSPPAPASTAEPDIAAAPPPSRPARLGRPPLSNRADGGPRRDTGAEAGTTSSAADRASCLAAVNAINADLSLRNEPPTPQQLAILKRGCK